MIIKILDPSGAEVGSLDLVDGYNVLLVDEPAPEPPPETEPPSEGEPPAEGEPPSEGEPPAEEPSEGSGEGGEPAPEEGPTDPPPAGDPPPGGATDPSGLFLYEDFEARAVGTKSIKVFGAGSPNWNTTVQTTRAYTGTKALENVAGSAPNTGGSWTVKIPNSSQLWVRTAFFFESGYRWSASSGHLKHLRIDPAGSPSCHIEENGELTWRPGERNVDTGVIVTKGEWNVIEWHFDESANVCRLWRNGVLGYEAAFPGNLPGGELKNHAFYWNGGSTNSSQKYWIDACAVALSADGLDTDAQGNRYIGL